MNLDERIEAAWKELSIGMEVATTRDRDLFASGYRAAMRSLYVEAKPEEMEIGREYTALIRQDGGSVQWFDGVMVSLSHKWRVCRYQGYGWNYWPRSEVLLSVQQSYIPSPAEIFGNQTN